MDKLSTKHFTFFILGSSLIAIKSYSSIFINMGGRDTWLLFLISSLIFSIAFLYLINISKDNLDIKEVFLSLNTFGKFLLYIFGLGLFFISVESASVLSSSIHSNFFLSTPIWYCLAFFLVCTSYVLFKNFNSILILVLITVFSTLIGDIILFILIGKYLDLSYLLPIMANGISYDKILAIILMLGSLSSICISLPYLKLLSSKKGLVKHSTIALIICFSIIVSSLISTISFFGPVRAGNIFYPEFVQSQRVQIADFLEFGELFYIFKNVCMWFIKYILASYSIILLFKDIINNKKIFIIIYSFVVFIVSWYITQNQYHFFQWLKILQLCLFLTLLITPILGFTIYKFKNNKLRKENFNGR